MKMLVGVCAAFVLALFALPAAAQEDIAKHKACKFCGMDREKFASSRILMEYGDGTTEGMCSLRCAAVEMALSIDKIPRTVWVGDYNTRALIDADTASWVIGGGKPGVMTRRAKWAFGTTAAAGTFVQENGGTVVGFDAAVKAAYEDLYEDTKMIRERREAKRRAAAEEK